MRASDGGTPATDAVMTLAIRPVNDAPAAADDALVIPLSGTTSVNVTANDSDLDGDALGVEIVTPPPGASATVQGGTIQVTPNAGTAGPTRVVYRVTDGAGGTSTATVRIVMGSVTPLFFRSDEDASGVNKVFRYDGLTRVAIATPIPQGETFDGFVTAANGSRMIYITRQPTLPPRHRLWLKELADPASAPVEIPTGASFFAYSIAISPDGNHATIWNEYIHLNNLSIRQFIDSGFEKPIFTRDSQRLFYATLLPGRRPGDQARSW